MFRFKRARENAVKEVIELGYVRAVAEEIIDVYLEHGALQAKERWPCEFSLFNERKTALDIIAENKLRLFKWQTEEAFKCEGAKE